MADKIYVGSAKEITTKYGSFLKISFGENDLKALEENKNEKGWVSIVVNKRKEVSDKGNTHYATIDTWKPEQKEGAEIDNAKGIPAIEYKSNVDASSLPF